MTRVEETVDLHRNGGLTCSQALLTVYGRPYGIDPGKARLLGRTLAAGVARQGETCGYVTAALMVLAHARDDETEAEARKKTHPVAMEFIRRFRERYGTTMCKELLGADISTQEGMKRVQEEKLVARHCYSADGIGRYAAALLEELI